MSGHGEAVYGTLVRGLSCAVVARSPASLTPRSGVRDGRVRDASSSNGFTRNANAPPSSVAARIAGVSRPVITITFVSCDTSRSRACTCRPFVSGIHTSSRARGTAWLRAYAKKTSASSKLCAFSPSESSGRDARLLCQPHQLGHGDQAHFLYHAGAMGLNRAKRDAEFHADLLVEQPGDHQPEDMTFSDTEIEAFLPRAVKGGK
jgi:hypothetical protein